MTEKEAFILIVQKEIFDNPSIYEENYPDMISMAKKYFDKLKEDKPTSTARLTENGAKVLKFMQENYQKYNNVFKAKDIGEGLFTSGRSVSGSMKKLITEGFCEKIGGDPVAYSITEKGKQKELN